MYNKVIVVMNHPKGFNFYIVIYIRKCQKHLLKNCCTKSDNI